MTLGVVIGTAAIISLAALGEGFRFEVKQRMEAGFELHVLIVFPGSITAGLGTPFTPSDVGKIEEVGNVSVVAPMMTLPKASFREQQRNRREDGRFQRRSSEFHENAGGIA
jgi:ABC-type antimicrobial peptide transport system permease subunit